MCFYLLTIFERNLVKKPMDVATFKEMANSEEYRTPPFTDYSDLDRTFWRNVQISVSSSCLCPHNVASLTLVL